MFVSLKKTLKAGIGSLAILVASAAGAIAADNATDSASDNQGWSYKAGTIPLTVNLSSVQSAAGPIYISVQKRGEYMGMKGHGAILKTTTNGDMTATVKVAEPGDYAVSVWHDMDDDTVFDMSESYMPLEGWGASGTVPKTRAPKFEDVKISIPQSGRDVAIALTYPNGA